MILSCVLVGLPGNELCAELFTSALLVALSTDLMRANGVADMVASVLVTIYMLHVNYLIIDLIQGQHHPNQLFLSGPSCKTL